MDTLIFDLDDTLMVDEVAATTAFLKTCLYAQARTGRNLPGFQAAIRRNCRTLWHQSPARDFCVQVGISSTEGLWASFAGAGRHLAVLRQWSSEYRKLSWLNTLKNFGIDNGRLATELSEKYIACRQELVVVYRDVEPVLSSLKTYFKLGLLTNGAPDLQRWKIFTSGLENYFDAIVISGEFGAGKPDRPVFEWLLSLLDASSRTSLMVGDSLQSDVRGAQGAGMKAAWLNRLDSGLEGSLLPDFTLHDLYELRALLERQLVVIPASGAVSR